MHKALEKYLSDESVRQILTVQCLEGSDAVVSFFVKTDGGWKEAGKGQAFIGRNGCGKEREGDAKTPLGDFGIRRAFGIKPNPGTSIEYLQIGPTTVACDENCPYYNTIIDIASVGQYQGEKMLEIVPQYDYGLETDFNNRNIYPLGSAIFIHCKGLKTYTGGCVALDEPFMETILRKAESGMRIIIEK